MDETRIPRRPEGWRELHEISNGGPSKAKDSCGSEESAEGETCWQEQGLERFLFPVLARQLGIGQATASNVSHDAGEAIRIHQLVIFRRTVAIAKSLFRKILVKVERHYRDVCPAKRSLQQALEILDPLSVDVSSHLLLRMINDFVDEFPFESLIASSLVRVLPCRARVKSR